MGAPAWTASTATPVFAYLNSWVKIVTTTTIRVLQIRVKTKVGAKQPQTRHWPTRRTLDATAPGVLMVNSAKTTSMIVSMWFVPVKKCALTLSMDLSANALKASRERIVPWKLTSVILLLA